MAGCHIQDGVTLNEIQMMQQCLSKRRRPIILFGKRPAYRHVMLSFARGTVLLSCPEQHSLLPAPWPTDILGNTRHVKGIRTIQPGTICVIPVWIALARRGCRLGSSEKNRLHGWTC